MAKKIEKTKDAENKKKQKKVKKEHHLWADFKKFITRGNVLDMAVGVVIGGAFGAIVTATVNILLSVCTWGVPGGLKGLVTVLPAANATQDGIAGIGQTFAAGDFSAVAKAYGQSQGAVDPLTYGTNFINSKYTLHGATYYYNNSAIIDWGTLINAIISFIIIALVLFIIIKVFTTLKKKREEFNKQLQEQYYEKHPEERPAPVVPGKPTPTELELLTQIRDSLAQKK
jgi:large conductance mechanosensitive channel